MSTSVMVASAIAIAAAGFGLGRVTASAEATATSVPATVECPDSLAQLLKEREERRIRHEQAVLDAAEEAQQVKLSPVQAAPGLPAQ